MSSDYVDEGDVLKANMIVRVLTQKLVKLATTHPNFMRVSRRYLSSYLATPTAVVIFAVVALAGCASENLRTAAQKDDISQVRALLAQGADPNAHDEYGVTALRIVTSGDIPWSQSNLAIARLLITNGANVNLGDGQGVTPLEAAACGGHINMVRLLLAHGADPRIKDNDGETAQSCAAEHDHSDVVALLSSRRYSHGRELGDSASSLGADRSGDRNNGRRLSIILKDNCSSPPIHNCEWDNATTRAFFANALARALAERGFLVENSGETYDLQLFVTITGIGTDESALGALLFTLHDNAIASARYRLTSVDGSAGLSGSASSTDPGSTRASLRKLAGNIATAVHGGFDRISASPNP